MESERAAGRRYRLLVRGELGDRFAPLLDGLRLQRRAGVTELTGESIDQARLARILEELQELGLELISVEVVDEAPPS